MQKILFILLAICLLAGACKKNKTTPNNEPIYQVKTQTGSSGNVTNFEYDNQGRISKLIETSGRWDFVYSNNLVTENVYDAGGALLFSNHHELNANGLVIKSSMVGDPIYTTFTYNSSKMVTVDETHDAPNIYRTNYYYNGERLDSTRSFNNGTLTNRMLLVYADTTNTISNQHTGFAFFGKQTGKAERTRTYYYYNASGVLLNTQINNYSYELDAQGRITREMMSSMPAGISRDNRYTYY